MTTFSEIAVQAQTQFLHGVSRGSLNYLAQNLFSMDNQLVVKLAPHNIAVGSYLAIGQELVYVIDVTGQTIKVLRNQLGTSANTAADPDVTHLEGTLVEVDPRFPTGLIYEQIMPEIQSWPEALFAVLRRDVVLGGTDHAATVGFTDMEPAEDGALGYIFGRRIYGLLRCERKPYTAHDRWTKVPNVTLRVDHDEADFAGGVALHFHQTYGRDTTFRCFFAVRFNFQDTPSDPDLDTRTLGIPDSMVDLISMGIAVRSLRSREVQRTNTSSGAQPRRSEDVPPGHITQTADNLQKMYDRRLSEEIERLNAAWGVPF